MAEATRVSALLRLMAGRRGNRITARDVATLQLAANLVAEQDTKLGQAFQAWRIEANEAITARTRHASMVDGLRALLGLHT